MLKSRPSTFKSATAIVTNTHPPGRDPERLNPHGRMSSPPYHLSYHDGNLYTLNLWGLMPKSTPTPPLHHNCHHNCHKPMPKRNGNPVSAPNRPSSGPHHVAIYMLTVPVMLLMAAYWSAAIMAAHQLEPVAPNHTMQQQLAHQTEVPATCKAAKQLHFAEDGDEPGGASESLYAPSSTPPSESIATADDADRPTKRRRRDEPAVTSAARTTGES